MAPDGTRISGWLAGARVFRPRKPAAKLNDIGLIRAPLRGEPASSPAAPDPGQDRATAAEKRNVAAGPTANPCNAAAEYGCR